MKEGGRERGKMKHPKEPAARQTPSGLSLSWAFGEKIGAPEPAKNTTGNRNVSVSGCLPRTQGSQASAQQESARGRCGECSVRGLARSGGGCCEYGAPHQQ